MKNFLNITIFIISCIAISSVTTIVIFQFIPEVKNECNPTSSLDTFIFILTLIVAVLAFMFAFIGYNEFTRVINYTKKVDDFEEQFNSKLNTTNARLIRQQRYIDYTFGYLYETSYSQLAQMKNQDDAQQLLNHLFHELQIAKLYRVNLDTDEARVVNINKIAALEYLEENGRKADIPHLDYIAQHDPDEHVRTRAIEVRAIIRNNDNN